MFFAPAYASRGSAFNWKNESPNRNGFIISSALSTESISLHECKSLEISFINLLSLSAAAWDESGFDFNHRDSIIVADVLDSPFPPCPEVLEIIMNQLERCCQESPPTHSEELKETISKVRNISVENIIVSSGSSSLMFSCLPRLLNKDSKVLILSPMYGEYEHVLKHIIGCEVTLFPLYPDDGFVLDIDSLIEISRSHDAVILVNPNSPTGVFSNGMKYLIEELNNPNIKSNCNTVSSKFAD